MAVRFDDLPMARVRSLGDMQAMTRKLLAGLERHGIVTVGFVNQIKLDVPREAGARRVLLASWLDHGHELGNHTYAHLRLHDITVAAWGADALQGERATGVPAHIAGLREQRQTTPAAEWDRNFRGQEFLVRALLWSGRSRDAVSLARALTELFPTSADAMVTLGFALGDAGDAQASAAAYAGGLERFARLPRHVPDPQFPQDDPGWYYLDQLVRTGLEMGRTSASLGLAQVVVRLYPDIARAHCRLGQALTLAGKPNDALAAFARAPELDAGDTRALAYRRHVAR